MKKKEAKKLIPHEAVQPKIEYTEVDSSQFEREMTMVYLQLKGEFSPQRTAGATDGLSITHDLLTPSMKDVDILEFSSLPSAAVDLKKATIPSVNELLSLSTDRTALQPIAIPKCNGEIACKRTDQRSNAVKVRIAGAKIDPIAISASVSNKAATSESVSKGCIGRTSSEVFFPIAEIQVHDATDTEIIDRVISKGSSAGNAAELFHPIAKIKIPNNIKSELAIPAAIGIKGSTRLPVLPHVNIENTTCTLLPTGNVSKRERIAVSIPCIEQNIQHIAPHISDFTGLLAGFRNPDIAELAGTLPSVLVPSVSIHKTEYTIRELPLSYDIVSNKIEMPKQQGIMYFLDKSDKKVHSCKNVFNIKITNIGVKDCASILKPVISVDKKCIALHTKNQTRVRIPHFSANVGGLADSFDIQPYSSVDAIWAEAEGVFGYFQQL